MKPTYLPAAHWSETSLAWVLRPIQRFIRQEASSGIVLLCATIAALVVANSPLAAGYTALLATHIGITVGPFRLDESVLYWINDGLMAIFFFVIGLELKREIMVGELANPRAATLPIIAALGGVLVPATIYSFANSNGGAARGWAVPTATDIAFAIGCMAILGSRVPYALKIFLAAVAIVDDLIAVLVIALFYTSDLNVAALGIGMSVIALLLLANLLGIRTPMVYLVLGGVVWLAFLRSGIHATIAGVLVACTIPARARIDAPTFLQRAHDLLAPFEQHAPATTLMLTDERQQSAVLALEQTCEHVQAPLQKLEHVLHPWVAFCIMPVFAFANAGVALSPHSLNSESLPVFLGVVAGLALGKPIGLIGASWLAVRATIAVLPAEVTWRHMRGAGVLAGIGFTMSLFIASLAFSDPALLATAKLAILLGSTLAGSYGLVLLWRGGTNRGGR